MRHTPSGSITDTTVCGGEKQALPQADNPCRGINRIVEDGDGWARPGSHDKWESLENIFKGWDSRLEPGSSKVESQSVSMQPIQPLSHIFVIKKLYSKDGSGIPRIFGTRGGIF